MEYLNEALKIISQKPISATHGLCSSLQKVVTNPGINSGAKGLYLLLLMLPPEKAEFMTQEDLTKKYAKETQVTLVRYFNKHLTPLKLAVRGHKKIDVNQTEQKTSSWATLIDLPTSRGPRPFLLRQRDSFIYLKLLDQYKKQYKRQGQKRLMLDIQAALTDPSWTFQAKGIFGVILFAGGVEPQDFIIPTLLQFLYESENKTKDNIDEMKEVSANHSVVRNALLLVSYL